MNLLNSDLPKELILSREKEDVINIFKNDPKNKMIVTDYQFISVIISQYDMSPNQVWFEYHVHPMKGQKYYEEYNYI